MIYEKAFAKINLALEVGKKNNEYHEVKNLMVPIDLYDELFFEKSNKDYIDCEPIIENNICLKALTLFKEKFDITECVHITLHKKIPIMAGLAGGSTDAAATLRGINRLFDVNASYDDLYDMACKLGSDVPFFLNSIPALCTGRGEIVTPTNLDFKGIPFLIIKPQFGLSTKEVYAKYVYSGVPKNQELKLLLDAINNKNFEEIDKFIFNDLEKVAISLNPKLEELYNKIDDLSYVPHISGSGPTIFILNTKYADMEIIKEIDNTLSLFMCHTI